MKRTLFKKVFVLCMMIVLSGSFIVPNIAGNNKNMDINPVEISVNQVEDEIEIIYEISDFEEFKPNK